MSDLSPDASLRMSEANLESSQNAGSGSKRIKRTNSSSSGAGSSDKASKPQDAAAAAAAPAGSAAAASVESPLDGSSGDASSPRTKGRRAVREGEYAGVPQARRGWEVEKKPLYESAPTKQTFAPVDDATAAEMRQNAEAQQAAHDQLVAEVAQAPLAFSAMPKQSELERATAAKFQSLLQQGAQEGVDLQCLMATLTGQFDDQDVQWDPDQLLMQLTSELNDRVAGDDEGAESPLANMEHLDPAQAQAYAASVQAQQQQQQQQGSGGAAASGGAARTRGAGSPTATATATAAATSSGASAAQQAGSSSSAAASDANAPAHGRRRK